MTTENLDERRQAKEEARFDEIAYDTAKVFAKLGLKWNRHENILANAIVDSLGALIAISAVDPVFALNAIAERLKATPWEEIKARHFGYSKLGVTGDIHMGPPK